MPQAAGVQTVGPFVGSVYGFGGPFSPPFEPLEGVGLELLSLKTVLWWQLNVWVIYEPLAHLLAYIVYSLLQGSPRFLFTLTWFMHLKW